MIDRAYDLHLAGYADVPACESAAKMPMRKVVGVSAGQLPHPPPEGRIVVPGLVVSGRVPGAFAPVRWLWLDAVVEDDDDGE